MPQAFKLFRIICTINDKALVTGSDHPTYKYNPPRGFPAGQDKWGWWDRGQWASSGGGGLWKTQEGVRFHLRNLCHDWALHYDPAPFPRYEGQCYERRERLTANADWSRLQHLVVEQILVTDYTAVKLPAHDFMGIPEAQAA